MRALRMIVVRALGFTALFALIILTARLIGNLRTPEAVQILHLTDCRLPCWLGIIPGKTSFDEAAQRVSATYPHMQIIGHMTIYANFQLGSSYGNAEITTRKDGIVHQMVLTLPASGGITLGDLGSLYGAPACQSGQPNLVPVYGSSARMVAYVMPYANSGTDYYTAVNDIEMFDFFNPCVA